MPKANSSTTVNLRRSVQDDVAHVTPNIVGTGLLALDIVLSKNEEGSVQLWAGGSCGNVLTMASYLGWRSYLLARLNGDRASRIVRTDIRGWDVRLDFVALPPQANTPIVTQVMSEDSSGERRHRFSMRCHRCGVRLPAYKAVPAAVMRDIAHSIPWHEAFYFDRVSAGALHLAKLSAEAGAVVVFEPSAIGDPRLFRQALTTAHIVKYSRERAGSFSQWLKGQRNGLIEIETLGGDGLRYRAQLPNVQTKRWKVLQAFVVDNVVDSAGAGDWCTAGLITTLASKGIDGLLSIASDELTEALTYGQALGAWTCHFEGSRAGMYEVSKSEFSAQISTIRRGKSPEIRQFEAPTSDARSVEHQQGLCPACSD